MAFRCGGIDPVALAKEDYPAFMGIWLNLERADWRQAGCVKRGIELALSTGDVPHAYADAMTPVETAADTVAWLENSTRHIARSTRR